MPIWWQADHSEEAAAGHRAEPAAPYEPGPSGSSKLHVLCLLGAVEPCGDVSVPPGGLQVQTPFGALWVAGKGSCGEELEAPAPADYMQGVYLCFALVGVFALAMLASPGQRHDLRRHVSVVVAGEASSHPAETDDESDGGERHAEQHDAASAAIAAGGIYQALAVLHPGVIGYFRWSRICARGWLCLAMQLYIPSSMLSQVLAEWEFHYLKSPIWFLTNAWDFLTVVIGLGMLYNLFASRCIEHLLSSVEATSYILARKHIGVLQSGLDRKDQRTKDEDIQGLVLLILEPSIEFGARANALLWSCLSMGTSLYAAVLLQATLLLRIATFTGSVEHVILVAVTLYFVLDVDRRMLDSDPRLRRSYHKHISSLELEGEDAQEARHPSCIVRLVAFLALVLRCVMPLALLAAALTAWRQRGSGQVVGGSPLCGFER